MATYYFFAKNQSNSFTSPSNWWLDPEHTTPALTTPSPADDVIVHNQPFFDLTNYTFTYNSFTVDNKNTSNDLIISNQSSASYNFSKTLTITCTTSAVFKTNVGVMCNINAANCYFYDSSYSSNLIAIAAMSKSAITALIYECLINAVNCYYYNNSYNLGKNISTFVYFYDSSSNETSTLSTVWFDYNQTEEYLYTKVLNGFISQTGYFYSNSKNFGIVNLYSTTYKQTNYIFASNNSLTHNKSYKLTTNIVIYSSIDNKNTSSTGDGIVLDKTYCSPNYNFTPQITNGINFYDLNSDTLTLTGSQILNAYSPNILNLTNASGNSITNFIFKDNSNSLLQLAGTASFYNNSYNQFPCTQLSGYFYDNSYNAGTVNTAYISSLNPNPKVYSQGSVINNLYYVTPQVANQILTLSDNQVLSNSVSGIYLDTNNQPLTSLVFKNNSSCSLPLSESQFLQNYFYNNSYLTTYLPNTSYFYDDSYSLGTVDTFVGYATGNNSYRYGTVKNSVIFKTASNQTFSLYRNQVFSMNISGANVYNSNLNSILNLNYYNKSSHVLASLPSSIKNINFYNNSFSGGDVTSPSVTANFYNNSYNASNIYNGIFFDNSINYGNVTNMTINNFAMNGYGGIYSNKTVNNNAYTTGINGTSLIL